MTTSRFSQTDLRAHSLVILAVALSACSSNSAGLSTADAGKGDATPTVDTAGIDGATWQGGTGGATGRRDAAGEAGLVLPGTGGMVSGAGGATALPGSGGRGIDAGGTAGAIGTGGASGGGGNARRDGGTPLDTRLDAPPVADTLADGPMVIRDVPADRTDAVAIDGGEACGNLDEPCCASRACNLPNLVCDGGGSGGGGTCVACGGADQACCEGGVCTAPNTSCVGGGRGGGTCR